MSIVRCEVQLKIKTNAMNRVLLENKAHGIDLQKIEKLRFYKVENKESSLIDLKQRISSLSSQIFYDTIMEACYFSNKEMGIDGSKIKFVIEVGMRPGVTDNPAHTAMEGLSLLGVKAKVASGYLYFLTGNLTKKEAEIIGREQLGNELINEVRVWESLEFFNEVRFENVSMPEVVMHFDPTAHEINLDISDEALMKISTDNCLALTLEEMKEVRSFYLSEKVKKERQQLKLPMFPTDVELEVIAQTWSEHCKHKIFAANISYVESGNGISKPLGNFDLKSLYKTYIKGATSDIKKNRGIDWLISVFSDNAGVVRFDNQIDLCIKAETHNSPSALDPYGGALTGILGVNRDILGVGMGARPVANTDVFCFGDPSLPQKGQEEYMPAGLKNPGRIFEGVHLGVEDGGNKSGIPTVNGAIYFDRDYSGKPLVFCGTVGVLPQKLKDGRDGAKKYVKPLDRIVMIGGEIGADGIHGATFSSLELDENSPATAVQIGDPLTQKRVGDFLMEARDLGLYSAITDNGAGGLSSSVGEMATMTGGAQIDLSLAPVKYPGLKPFELMISESQERMTLAVPPEKLNDFMKLAKRRNVLASDLGFFDDSGRLNIYYKKDLVASMDLHWLHDGLLDMNLSAVWDGPRERKNWLPNIKKLNLNATFDKATLTTLLKTSNIASKESFVRRYDHEVQAATALKPFGGKECDGPNDSGVIWLYPHGGEKDNAVSIGCGLAPRVGVIDPYMMAQFAVDEAIRNIVATGADIDKVCLLDNFCWPDPVKTAKNFDGDYKLGQLVRTCKGLYDICMTYGAPLVSGKDSMKNDFRGKNRKGDDLQISILPTLLVTAMGQTSVKRILSSDFKKDGEIIFVLGKSSSGLSQSELLEIYELPYESALPSIDIESNYKLYQSMKTAMDEGILSSCHDISDGGALVAISESCIGGRIGADLKIETNENMYDYLYNEGPGRFIVSVSKQNESKFLNHFKAFDTIKCGHTTLEPQLNLTFNGQKLADWKIEELVSSFKREW